MNTWTAIGYIFLGFGLIFLLLGLILGALASSAFQFFPQLAQTVFLATATPWVIISVLSFVVGTVGYIAGRTNHTAQQTSHTLDYGQTNLPQPKVSACPSCGQPMVYVQEYERWYCPHERKYV